MKTGSILCVVVIALCLWATDATADVPHYINYQGTLTDSSGNSVTGIEPMTFSLFADSTGGTSLWSENYTAVEVTNGLFQVLLGSNSTFPNDLFNGQDLWLEIIINTETLIPRTPFGSIPYGFKAVHSDTASYALAGGSAASAWLLTGNSGTDSTNFLGTTDSTTLEFRVNNLRALRLEPAWSSYYGVCPNFIAGCYINSAPGAYGATIGGGGAPGGPNVVYGILGTIGGGVTNSVSGQVGTIGGGSNNQVTSPFATVGGGKTNIASDSYAAVAGGWHNTASGNISTIAGGEQNTASDAYATIGGGWGNTASNLYTTIGGGMFNTASGLWAIIGGGSDNDAAGDYAIIGGGYLNDATGDYATIPGGIFNRAQGKYSFASGRRAKADHDGCFVWGDSTDSDIATSDVNQIRMRASGGTIIYSDADMTTGVSLAPGSGSWSSVSDSTLKRNIHLVDAAQILDKVSQLPIKQWNYKSQDPTIEHVGPMAQDFWRLFHLGEDSLRISTIDPDGIALAAIQQLHKENQQLKEELNELRRLVETMVAP